MIKLFSLSLFHLFLISKKIIAKINETKSWFFEKINKIDKLLARLIKKKVERGQTNKIRNKKRKMTTNTTE